MSDKKKKGTSYADRQNAAQGRRVFATDRTGDPAPVDVVAPKPDKSRVPGQNYWVLTCCAPENTRVKCSTVAVKNSGSFNTEAEANKQAERIRDEDDRFDVHVVDMNVFLTVPMPADIKPFVHKEYTDKYMTRIMYGLQESLRQSRKEMDERVAKDRAKAEAELRKKYGPDYVPVTKTETVKQYEQESLARDVATQDTTYSQRDVMESLASYMQNCPGSINPQAAGDFVRYMQAKQEAEKQFQKKDEEDAAAAAASEPPQPV
jgi:hypothetical protein